MSKSARITIVVLIVVLLITAFFVYVTQKRNEVRQLDQSAAASALANSTSTENFTDFEGNVIDLQQYLGKTLIVNSWASWSPSSVAELTLLTSVADEYRDQGVIVIGINRAESKSTAVRFLATLGLSESVKLIVDTDDRYYRAIEGYTMPETIFYDTKGDVMAHKRGTLTAVEIKYILDQILESEL